MVCLGTQSGSLTYSRSTRLLFRRNVRITYSTSSRPLSTKIWPRNSAFSLGLEVRYLLKLPRTQRHGFATHSCTGTGAGEPRSNITLDRSLRIGSCHSNITCIVDHCRIFDAAPLRLHATEPSCTTLRPPVH